MVMALKGEVEAQVGEVEGKKVTRTHISYEFQLGGGWRRYGWQQWDFCEF